MGSRVERQGRRCLAIWNALGTVCAAASNRSESLCEVVQSRKYVGIAQCEQKGRWRGVPEEAGIVY